MKLVSLLEFACSQLGNNLFKENYKKVFMSYYNFLYKKVNLDELVPFLNNEPVVIIPFHIHHKGSDYHAEQHIEYSELSKNCIFKDVKIKVYDDGKYTLFGWYVLGGKLYKKEQSEYVPVNILVRDLIEYGLIINDEYLNVIFGSENVQLIKKIKL